MHQAGTHATTAQQAAAQVTAANTLPAGGVTEQILAKASNTDGDATWVDPPTGGAVPERYIVDVVTTPYTLPAEDLAAADGKILVLKVAVNDAVLTVHHSASNSPWHEVMATKDTNRFRFTGGVSVNGVGDSNEWIAGSQTVMLNKSAADSYPYYYVHGATMMEADVAAPVASAEVVKDAWTLLHTNTGGLPEHEGIKANGTAIQFDVIVSGDSAPIVRTAYSNYLLDGAWSADLTITGTTANNNTNITLFAVDRETGNKTELLKLQDGAGTNLQLRPFSLGYYYLLDETQVRTLSVNATGMATLAFNARHDGFGTTPYVKSYSFQIPYARYYLEWDYGYTKGLAYTPIIFDKSDGQPYIDSGVPFDKPDHEVTSSDIASKSAVPGNVSGKVLAELLPSDELPPAIWSGNAGSAIILDSTIRQYREFLVEGSDGYRHISRVIPALNLTPFSEGGGERWHGGMAGGLYYSAHATVQESYFSGDVYKWKFYLMNSFGRGVSNKFNITKIRGIK